MAITSGFFDSVNGDRTYDADQMSNYFDGLVSNGVYESIGDRFLVRSANNGMGITVGTGRAIIQSRWVKNDATATLTLDPSDVQLNRVDAVVLRLDTNARDISLVIKKGTAVSGTPTIPAITRNESVYELYIAAVYVSKGATQPTSITDLRPSSYCGWVTGVVQQVDTSDLFNQWLLAYTRQFNTFQAFIDDKEAAFNEWFTKLTKQLTVEAGMTKLQNVIWISASSNAVPINEINSELEDYDENSDILFVYMEGVYLTEGVDYTFDTMKVGSYTYKLVSLKKAVGKQTQFTLVVLRSTLGKSVLVAGDATPDIDGVEKSIVDAIVSDAVTVDLLDEPYASSLENAYIDDNSGAIVSSYSSRVCCTEFVDFPADRERMVVDVQISGAAGRWYCYIYDADGNYLKSITSSSDSISGEKYWTHIASGEARAIPSTGAKMRVICRTSSGGDISPSDVNLFKVTFY